MPGTANANTLAIGQQIVSYMSALVYPGTSTVVYTLAQLEAIKDVIDLTASGGVCCEVYGDTDESERRGFGGRIWDTQEWFILSLCALDTPAHAQQIYPVRDALVYPFQQSATLGGGVSNLFQVQLKPSMKFFRVSRSGQWLRAHLAVLETKQEWQVVGGVIS
jgi:hypothetical protein